MQYKHKRTGQIIEEHYFRSLSECYRRDYIPYSSSSYHNSSDIGTDYALIIAASLLTDDSSSSFSSNSSSTDDSFNGFGGGDGGGGGASGEW